MQTTRAAGSGTGAARLTTYEMADNNWVRGFTYGRDVIGTSAATSFLYSTLANGRYATPFTQVWIRPRLTQASLSFAAIPDTGTAAQTAVPLARNGALAAGWGVVGTGTGAGGIGELATEVQVMAQVGSVMYVGGNFTGVQQGATGTPIAQAYLAAFDVATGDWIPSFRPVLNHQVKALAALPDGRLAVGGDFSTVNGAARSGLAIIDPSSGQVATNVATVENRINGGTVSVRGLEASGGRLYLAGSFTHLVGSGGEAFTRNAGRIELATGRGDSGWNPNLNGTVAALDVAADGARVYLSGYFTTSGSTTADRAAAISTGATATPVTPAWQPTFSTAGSARYQQAVLQVGNRVWLGGSQHSMFSYDTSTFALNSSHVTRSGGDLQAIASNGRASSTAAATAVTGATRAPPTTTRSARVRRTRPGSRPARSPSSAPGTTRQAAS